MRRSWTSLGACLVTAAAIGFAAPAPASAQVVMKLASATINDVQHEWQKVFAVELAKRVGDQVKVEIYPASQLGAIPRMAEGVQLGTIESGEALRRQPRGIDEDRPGIGIADAAHHRRGIIVPEQ